MNLFKSKILNYSLNIIIPLGLGALVGYLSGSFNGYSNFNQPSFAPPGILFPIVWSILYLLMGVSITLISDSSLIEKENAKKLYYTQLVINLIWSFLFFKLKWLLISALWIILLIYFVIKMINAFKQINKKAAYLQLPYLLWLIFAFILNISIYVIN